MDFYGDKRLLELQTLMKRIPFPKWAKMSFLSTGEELEALPATAFAYPEKRVFPINSRFNTWLSGAYCFNKYAQVPFQVIKNILDAGKSFYLDYDFRELANHLLVRPSIKDADYGLITRHAGLPIKKYLMQTPAQVKVAEKYFARNYKKYPLDWRRQISCNMVKKAEIYGIKLTSPEVFSYSASQIADTNVARFNILSRALFAKHPLIQGGLYKIAKELSPIKDPLITVQMLKQFDKIAGLEKFYDKGIKDPYLSIFAQPKVSVIDTINIKGDHYLLSDIAQLTPEDLSPLGKEFTSRVVGPEGTIDRVKFKAGYRELASPSLALLKKILDQKLPAERPLG